MNKLLTLIGLSFIGTLMLAETATAQTGLAASMLGADSTGLGGLGAGWMWPARRFDSGWAGTPVDSGSGGRSARGAEKAGPAPSVPLPPLSVSRHGRTLEGGLAPSPRQNRTGSLPSPASSRLL